LKSGDRPWGILVIDVLWRPSELQDEHETGFYEIVAEAVADLVFVVRDDPDAVGPCSDEFQPV
jgi:hypothetical protein